MKEYRYLCVGTVDSNGIKGEVSLVITVQAKNVEHGLDRARLKFVRFLDSRNTTVPGPGFGAVSFTLQD